LAHLGRIAVVGAARQTEAVLMMSGRQQSTVSEKVAAARVHLIKLLELLDIKVETNANDGRV
jgi:hypothetical protein